MTSCDHILYEGTANMALCGNRRCTPVGAASLIPGGEPSHYTHLDCSHLAQPTVPCFTLFPARLLLLLVVPALFMVPPFDLNAHCWLVFTTHLAWRIYRSQVRPGQHASEGCAGHGCGEVGGATYRHTHRALCVFMSRSGAGGFLGWLPACNSYPGGGGGRCGRGSQGGAASAAAALLPTLLAIPAGVSHLQAGKGQGAAKGAGERHRSDAESWERLGPTTWHGRSWLEGSWQVQRDVVAAPKPAQRLHSRCQRPSPWRALRPSCRPPPGLQCPYQSCVFR